MSDDAYTPDRLLEFLRESPKQGLLNPAVARSRASAVEALFVELTDQEKADIRSIDLEKLCARLHKIQGSSIRPEVVTLYKTRAQEALTDYVAWLGDPKSFSSIGAHSLRRDKRGFGSEQENAQEAKALEETALAVSDRRKDLIAVPLREGVTVYVTHLPLDLTGKEAAKISRVIQALANEAGREDASVQEATRGDPDRQG